MLLFHGLNVPIEQPAIMNRRPTLDFGTGFYTTTNRQQAEEFARKVCLRRKAQGGNPTVSVYEIDLDEAFSMLETIKFDAPNREWLRFVVHNRRNGRSSNCRANLIMGPVANDDVFETIALYESGLINEEDAIKRFKVKELFDQILFCDSKALAYLLFREAYELEA